MAYPKFLYHADLAPSGRLIRDAAGEPTESGWVDTPQKFDPKYVEPEKLVPDGSVPADRPGYIPQAYPSFRYSESGEARVVRTAADDAALDPQDWKHSPSDFLPKTDVAIAPPPPPAEPVIFDPLNPPPAPPESHVTPPPPQPDGPVEPPQLSAAKQKAELYAASATDVIAKVNAMSDIPMLQVVKGFEETNPRKRATVIRAVDARLAQLGYVAPGI